MSNATTKVEVLDDQIILTESGKYQQIGHSRTYVRTASEIVLRNDDRGTTAGNVLENALYINYSGLAAAYAKQ